MQDSSPDDRALLGPLVLAILPALLMILGLFPKILPCAVVAGIPFVGFGHAALCFVAFLGLMRVSLDGTSIRWWVAMATVVMFGVCAACAGVGNVLGGPRTMCFPHEGGRMIVRSRPTADPGACEVRPCWCSGLRCRCGEPKTAYRGAFSISCGGIAVAEGDRVRVGGGEIWWPLAGEAGP